MKKILSVFIVSAFAATPLLVLAQDVSVNVNADVSANVSAPGATAHVKAQGEVKADVVAKAKDRANQEIQRRIDNLTKLQTRITNATHISEGGKTNITGAITAQVSTLQTLQAKIDADDGTTTLKEDIKSITDSYRIYALVMPQLAITAAADRIIDVADAMNQLAGKLDTRLSGDAGTTASSSASVALADMKAKVADAQAKASASATAVVGLKPDNGDKTVMASNLKALKDARAQIQAAQQDLVAARKDSKIILKALHIDVSAAASASASSTSATP